jgi:hypothetical protein
MVLFGCAASYSQVPTSGAVLWLRADTLVTFTTPSGASEQVSTWKSRVGGHTATAGAGSALTSKPINGKAGILFNGVSFLEAPSVFPVGKDYTIYLVTEWSGLHSANNMISGQNRALFTSSPGQPTVLHAGDFNRLLMAESALSGPTVVRITYSEATRLATIAHNGKEVARGEIPSNIDSIIYIGAYQRGYCYNGTISEILLYNRIPAEQERSAIEKYLHQRYGIPQYKEPAPKSVSILEAPKNLAVVSAGRAYNIVYRVNTENVRSVKIYTATGGLPSLRTIYDVQAGSTDTISWTSPPAGFNESTIIVMADTGSPLLDTAYVAKSIVSGVAFTVTGQSNSIFGDAAVLPSAYARTFGKNFSSSASDTVFYGSKADGNGGGIHVGAWGLHLQNAIADQMGSPSLCINGGVGGTRIEQHLPDQSNRLNRATIYGSWLYRIIKSGRRDDIRWLFWYQGESNHDTEDYIKLFGQLYNAWKEDLPNLEYVVVVQIRPGCAGPNHAKLRDEQRRLEYAFPNVIVHAANALPAHDGCHYGGQGYGALGSQLFDVYQRNELGMQPGVYRSSPTVKRVAPINSTTVRVEFERAGGLRMTSDVLVAGAVRTSTDAWFADSDSKMHPTSVSVSGSSVVLTFPSTVSRVSYVPDYAYDDGTTVFQGPWLVNSQGVGALSFHDVPITTTDIEDFPEYPDTSDNLLIQQSSLPTHPALQNVRHIYTVNGVRLDIEGKGAAALQPGLYFMLIDLQPRCFVVVP